MESRTAQERLTRSVRPSASSLIGEVKWTGVDATVILRAPRRNAAVPKRGWMTDGATHDFVEQQVSSVVRVNGRRRGPRRRSRHDPPSGQSEKSGAVDSSGNEAILEGVQCPQPS